MTMIGLHGFKDRQLIVQRFPERLRPRGGWFFWVRRELARALKPIFSVSA
jgi:hypothetical protein